ncbi:MAG: transposase [Candidatus Aenigmatarchaeota archaeon]
MPRKAKGSSPHHDLTSEIVVKFELLFSKGQSPSLATLIEEIFNYLTAKERELYLSKNQDEQKNGFYSRTLTTYFGKLNLKIPRIRSS